jgi:hypothetical protein
LWFRSLPVDKDIAIISTTNTFLSMRFFMGFDLSLKDVRSFLPILFIAPNCHRQAGAALNLQ